MKSEQEILDKIADLQNGKSKLVEASNYKSILQSFNDQIQILEWILENISKQNKIFGGGKR